MQPLSILALLIFSGVVLVEIVDGNESVTIHSFDIPVRSRVVQIDSRFAPQFEPTETAQVPMVKIVRGELTDPYLTDLNGDRIFDGDNPRPVLNAESELPTQGPLHFSRSVPFFTIHKNYENLELFLLGHGYTDFALERAGHGLQESKRESGIANESSFKRTLERKPLIGLLRFKSQSEFFKYVIVSGEKIEGRIELKSLAYNQILQNSAPAILDLACKKYSEQESVRSEFFQFEQRKSFCEKRASERNLDLGSKTAIDFVESLSDEMLDWDNTIERKGIQIKIESSHILKIDLVKGEKAEPSLDAAQWRRFGTKPDPLIAGDSKTSLWNEIEFNQIQVNGKPLSIGIASLFDLDLQPSFFVCSNLGESHYLFAGVRDSTANESLMVFPAMSAETGKLEEFRIFHLSPDLVFHSLRWNLWIPQEDLPLTDLQRFRFWMGPVTPIGE